MNVSCPHCKKMLVIPDNTAPGKRVSCPQCKQHFLLPAAVARPADPPPPPMRAARAAVPASVNPAIAPGPPPPPPIPVIPPIGPARKRILALDLSSALLQRIVAIGFIAMIGLFFAPWTQVLVPAKLTADPSAAPLKNLALILDCSSSMKESIASGVKIQAVKAAIDELIKNLPGETNLTCILTGHEREPQVKAKVIRGLAPLSSGREELIKEIDKVDAIGQSSISEAIKLAGEELGNDKGNGGIVVITDGPDISGGDPSAQADIVARRPNLTYGVNIIGYGVILPDLRKLRDIAVKGRGKFYDTQTLRIWRRRSP